VKPAHDVAAGQSGDEQTWPRPLRGAAAAADVTQGRPLTADRSLVHFFAFYIYIFFIIIIIASLGIYFTL